MSRRVIIIGGGAAGLMAAYFAALEGASVLLLDKNRIPGRKLRITGKGRCNLTNDCDCPTFMKNIPNNGRFLYSALSSFMPQDVMLFFEKNGLPLKVERGRRVFPQSDNANDVAEMLIRICRAKGVTFQQAKVTGVICKEGNVNAVQTEEGEFRCDACILCTGGMSYPLTGSNGDGYRLAESLGHTITPLRASLVPLESEDLCCSRLQGLSLRNVELNIYEDGKLLFCEQGEMLFTHFGISGPLVLSASAHMRRFNTSAYRAEIDLKPALDEKSLDLRLQRDMRKYQNKTMSNALVDLLPRAMIPEIIRISEIPEGQQANNLTREQRRALLLALKCFPLSISGTRPIAEAIVTSGGINLKELNPHTMGSKLIGGLYCAGEILDIDAYTGGYNLQIAWATGRMAGIHAAQQNANQIKSGEEK